MKNSTHQTTIDYTDYPENFMIQLMPDTDYVLKDGDKETAFSAYTHAFLKSNQILTYADLTADLSSAVYYRKTHPVLIHYQNMDYIWICEENKDGFLIGASFYYLTEYHSFGSDNGLINLRIKENILDPADFLMKKFINCFGSAATSVSFKINELGKPEENQNNNKYYCIDTPYSDEVLILNDEIQAWVYANQNTGMSFVKTLPAETKFRRLRVPKNEKYKYVEGILDDGRVFRVVEEYWFSEPTAYQAMLDKKGNQFSYSIFKPVFCAPANS